MLDVVFLVIPSNVSRELKAYCPSTFSCARVFAEVFADITPKSWRVCRFASHWYVARVDQSTLDSICL